MKLISDGFMDVLADLGLPRQSWTAAGDPCRDIALHSEFHAGNRDQGIER
jgi:hypothetical protein